MSEVENNLVNKKIAFIGCGNMASAIIGGLINAGCLASNIIASNPSDNKLKQLKSLYGLNTCNDNLVAADFADIIILSVKPQIMTQVCQQLASLQLNDKLLVSVAAGYQTGQMIEHLRQSPPIVRCMPNTPALIGEGATGLYATDNVSSALKQSCEMIFQAVGKTIWIAQETQMNIVTAIAGSSPAYFFLMMEAMVEQAVASGLSEQQAVELITQSASGAAQLAQASPQQSLKSLRQAVTSPGGTTAAAIESFQQAGFEAIVKQAVIASINRGNELGGS